MNLMKKVAAWLSLLIAALLLFSCEQLTTTTETEPAKLEVYVYGNAGPWPDVGVRAYLNEADANASKNHLESAKTNKGGVALLSLPSHGNYWMRAEIGNAVIVRPIGTLKEGRNFIDLRLY